MAFSPAQYAAAGKWIADNLSNPALVRAKAEELGLTYNDILKAAKTVNGSITLDQVKSYIGPLSTEPTPPASPPVAPVFNPTATVSNQPTGTGNVPPVVQPPDTVQTITVNPAATAVERPLSSYTDAELISGAVGLLRAGRTVPEIQSWAASQGLSANRIASTIAAAQQQLGQPAPVVQPPSTTTGPTTTGPTTTGPTTTGPTTTGPTTTGPTTTVPPPAEKPLTAYTDPELIQGALGILKAGRGATELQSWATSQGLDAARASAAINEALRLQSAELRQGQGDTTTRPDLSQNPTGSGITTSYVREAPYIEAYKMGLMEQAQKLGTTPYLLPEFRVAGLTPEQQKASTLTTQGIGAYQPYLQRGSQYIQTAAEQGIVPAANTYFGIDAATAYKPAQEAMSASQAGIASIVPTVAPAFIQGYNALGSAERGLRGIGGVFTPQGLERFTPEQYAEAGKFIEANFNNPKLIAQRAAAMGLTLEELTRAAQTVAPDVTTESVSKYFEQVGYKPQQGGLINQFMNPYQEQVIDEATRRINRQGDISRQSLQAQAVRAGAFGGTREGTQRGELERAISDQRNAAIVGGLQQGYTQALGSAQQAYEQNQQRALAGIGQQAALGAQYGQLGTQAAGVIGQQAALQQQLGQGIGALTSQELQTQLQKAAGLGSLSTQAANMGVQQAALGEAAQRMGQTDVQNLFGMGEAQRQLQQQNIEAQRQTALQNIYQPYQQLGLVGDIYRGAPTTQMATSITQQQQQSPFMQALGLGIGALSTAAAANKLF